MSRLQQFRKIEAELERSQNQCENTVVMNNDDFKNGKLTASGYTRLKQECDYINYKDEIEIIVPHDIDKFRETLKQMAAIELSKIKKDKHEMMLMSFVLLATGILWFTLSQVFSNQKIISEILMVATWCFTWTALAKWFFERGGLRKRRYSLLHILTAKVTAK